MEKISVVIPTYNNEKTIKEAIDSVMQQTVLPSEIILVDDYSKDDTVLVVNYMENPLVKVFINQVNLGCGRNLQKGVNLASNDVIFFLCGDDVIIEKSLFYLISTVMSIDDVGVVSRRYYWFDKDVNKPIRIKEMYENNTLSSVSGLDQISGIVLKKSKMLNQFSNEPFIEMASVAYPMIKKSNRVVYIPYPTIAVRTGYSGSMNPKVYFKSPTELWMSVVDDEGVRDELILRNYVGLVQIKNYGTHKQLLREIGVLIKHRKKNLLSIKFWFWALLTLLTPRSILRKLVLLYRRIPK